MLNILMQECFFDKCSKCSKHVLFSKENVFENLETFENSGNSEHFEDFERSEYFEIFPLVFDYLIQKS